MHPRKLSPPKGDRGVYDLRRLAGQIRERLETGRPIRLLETTAMLVERGLNAAATFLEESDQNHYRIEVYDDRHNLVQVVGTLHHGTPARAAFHAEVEKRKDETVLLFHRGREIARHDAVPKMGAKPQPVTTFSRMLGLGMINADCECGCGYRTRIDARGLPPDQSLDAFGAGMRCVDCGGQGMTVRMDLHEFYLVLDGRTEGP